MKFKFIASAILNSLLISFIANSYFLIKEIPQILFGIIPMFIIINIFGGVLIPFVNNKRFVVCQHGTIMLYSFYASIIVSTVFQIIFAIKSIPNDYMTFIWNFVTCFGVNFVIFWNGIICVYLTSAQLGVKWRVIGLICGLIPIVNLIVLFLILKATTNECMFETKKSEINKGRREQKEPARRL